MKVGYPSRMRRIAAFLAVGMLVGTAWAAENWPQFRGPNQGRSDARNLPLKWSEKENIKWQTAVHGKAWSSPVVFGDQIWMTTASEDGRELSGVCIDKNSGRIIHDLKLFDVAVPQFAHKFNSYGSPSPVIEPGRVYITFGSPGTACLDTTSGKRIWERTDFVCNHFRGAGSSPVIFNNLLLMHFDGSDYQYVVGLNKNNGETVWKTPRSVDYGDLDRNGKPQADGDFRKAFSTPVIADFGGGPVMLSLGSKAFYAYEPQGGKELWRVENRNCHSGSSTPVFGNGTIYTCMGFGKGELWAIRPGGSGNVTDSHVAWKVKKNVPCKPSVLLIGDLVFMIDDNGIASCVDAKSGEDVWRTRVGGNYSAAPLYADGKIYFFSEEGKTTVIEAGRQYKVLAESQLGDGFMATPAMVDGALILRSRTKVYRVGN
jgi:outer membrane protein assembly factor BamB